MFFFSKISQKYDLADNKILLHKEMLENATTDMQNREPSNGMVPYSPDFSTSSSRQKQEKKTVKKKERKKGKKMNALLVPRF